MRVTKASTLALAHLRTSARSRAHSGSWVRSKMRVRPSRRVSGRQPLRALPRRRCTP